MTVAGRDLGRDLTRALTIAQPVSAWLSHGVPNFEVHSSFPNAINLVAPGGGFLTLLARSVADGPFALRLPCDRLPAVLPRSPVTTSGGCLAVGPMRVDWRAAACWDPQLTPLQIETVAVDPVLNRLCGIHTPLVSALVGRPRPDSLPAPLPFDLRLEHRAGEALAALRDGLAGDASRLAAAVRLLLGFGPGFTPAGDDVLVGVLAAQQMLGDARLGKPSSLGSSTTALSAAFLAAAYRGDFAAHWHVLREALDTGEHRQIAAAADEILVYGASSGADALVGLVLGIRAHAGRGRHGAGPDFGS